MAWARRRRIDTAGQRWSHACHANIGARRVPATGVRTRARGGCFGDLLLRLSAPGREKLLQSPQLEVRIGGAEANVGVSLSCFGHQVAAVGTVAHPGEPCPFCKLLERFHLDHRIQASYPARPALDMTERQLGMLALFHKLSPEAEGDSPSE